MMPQCQEVRFVDVVLAWKSCPSAKKYDLMPLFRPRSDASGLQYDLMPLFWLRNAKKYDLLPLFWRRSDAPVLSSRFFAVVLVSKCCLSAKKYVLLPLFWPPKVMPQC